MAISLNQLQSAVANIPPHLPLDEQIRELSSIALPSLQELNPDDLKSFARNLKSSADNFLRNDNILQFVILSAAVLPGLIKSLKDAYSPGKAFVKAESQKSAMEKIGKKKWVDTSAGFNSIFPPGLSALFHIKGTKKALSAEFDSVAKMSLEEFEDQLLDRHARVSESLDRLEKNLTLSAVKIVAHRFINNMSPEQTEALICSGAAFFKDLFENAQNNKPLTITDARQGKDFAKALNQSLVFVEKALEEAGVADLSQKRKSSSAPATPKNG